MQYARGARTPDQTLLDVGCQKKSRPGSLGLPPNLGLIHDSLPLNHPQRSVEYLVHNHTIASALSYYDAVGPERYYDLSTGAKTIHFERGQARFTNERMRAMRTAFCRKCSEDDMTSIGIRLTRCNHQLPGVAFCGRCQSELEWECPMCFQRAGGRRWLRLAPICQNPSHPREYLHETLSDNYDELIQLSAELSAISRRVSPYRNIPWSQVFDHAAIALGLRRGNHISTHKLIALLHATFSPTLLHSLRLSEKREDGELVMSATHFQSLRPHLHLVQKTMLTMAVAGTVENFESLIAAEYPTSKRGSSVWVPIWRESAVMDYRNEVPMGQIVENAGVSRDVIAAELKALGFKARKQNINGCKQLNGAIAAVTTGMLVADAAYRFKVSVQQILMEISKRDAVLHEKVSRHHFAHKRKLYRAELLCCMQTNPGVSRKQLHGLARYAVLWLLKNDSDWAESRLPARSRHQGRRRGFTVRLSVPEAEKLLRAAHASILRREKTTKITIGVLARESTVPKGMIANNPALAEIVTKFSESKEDYLRRCIAIYLAEGHTRATDFVSRRALRDEQRLSALKLFDELAGLQHQDFDSR